jgi:hypothetical protein
MGGMGDPFGLVADESDYLIHPAKIADGQGTRLYGNYRFTFQGVGTLGYDVDVFAPLVPVPVFSSRYFTSGNNQTHDISTGIAFPAGPGRMGIFADYKLARGDFDGDAGISPFGNFSNYDLKNKLEDFSLRLLYGLPIGGSFKLGGEFQLAYRQEENETFFVRPLGPFFSRNTIFGSLSFPLDFDVNFYPFMTPYDSSYMEALFKGSVEGAIGPLTAAFTMRGSFLFGGNNEFSSGGTAILPGGLDLNGDVDGWRLGGDLWLRYPLKDDLAIPFLARIDYWEKTRDGDGEGVPGVPPVPFNYKNKEKSFALDVGGGVDKDFGKGTRAAAGIYYSYVNATNDFELMAPSIGWLFDRSDNPDTSEHRIQLRLAGEHALTPAIALQMGINAFFGWLNEDYSNTRMGIFPIFEDASLKGHRWGIGGSLGATVRVFKGLALEPFLAAGYQETMLDGNGTTTSIGIARIDMDKTTQEWFTAAGLSILLDL